MSDSGREQDFHSPSPQRNYGSMDNLPVIEPVPVVEVDVVEPNAEASEAFEAPAVDSVDPPHGGVR
jgi:hypothetical protein